MQNFDLRFIDNYEELEKEFTMKKGALSVCGISLPNFPLELV